MLDALGGSKCKCSVPGPCVKVAFQTYVSCAPNPCGVSKNIPTPIGYIHVGPRASLMLRSKFGGNGKIFCEGLLHIAHVVFKDLSGTYLLVF